MNYSVIIPTHNRQSVLPRALDSVLSQTLKPTEIIIVDDGSDDETVELLKRAYPKQEYPNIKVATQTNQGVSVARNVGFHRTSTDWIALLDSDDEWLPDKMERQFAQLQSTGLLVCHTEEIWIRNGVRVNAKYKHKKKSGDIFADCLSLCAMSPSSIVLHRHVWEKYGGFDPQFPVCEDYDLWLQICHEHEVCLVEEASIIKYGGHEDQLSRRYFAMDKYRVLAMEKLLRRDISDTKQQMLQNKLQEKLHILMLGATKHQNEELLAFCLQRQ